ncbi:hypothetical protein V1522DRAFT_413942 [Lipomyces starkeyi]
MDRQLTIVCHHMSYRYIYILSKDPKKTSKTARRTADIAGLIPETGPTSRHRTLMQLTELIDIVRRPFSPDTRGGGACYSRGVRSSVRGNRK